MRTAKFISSLTLTAALLATPASAADTKQMDELYKGFKDGYAQFADLSTEAEGVKKAKADLLERFRGHFSSALSSALIEDLRGAFNGAFDEIAGPNRVKDALGSEKAAIDKEIERLKGLKGNLGGTKGELNSKITGLGSEKTKWDGEVNRLINEIKKLGGQASLIGDLPIYAAYPGRPAVFVDPAQRRIRPRFRPLHPVRLAHWKRSPHGHSPPGKNKKASEAENRANNMRRDFPGVADKIDNQGVDQLKIMGDPNKGLRGLKNLGTPDSIVNFKVKLPPPPPIPDVPTPDPNAGRITDLKKQLAVARRNATGVDGRIGELAAEIGVLDVNIGTINDSIRSLTTRKGQLDAAAAGIAVAKKYSQLNGKELFQLNSVTWTGATAKAVFEAGKTKVTANVTIFGTNASVSTDWAFTKATASLSTMVSAIKKTAPYKADIGG